MPNHPTNIAPPNIVGRRPKKYLTNFEFLVQSVKAHGDSKECLIWPYVTASKNRAMVFHNGTMRAVSRVTYETFVGPIPDGLWILHKCDNGRCYSLNCFFLGTHKDNVADMMQKNRRPKGEGVTQHKLNETDVIEIRRLYRYGKKSTGAADLGRRFGVDSKTISRIALGIKWKHIPLPN